MSPTLLLRIVNLILLVTVTLAGVEPTKSIATPKTNFHGFEKTALAFAGHPTPSSSEGLPPQSTCTPIPPPPPISMPVWSLACPSVLAGGGDDNAVAPPTSTTSMNIVTFATPVSVAQPKLWGISLYHNTLTKDSFIANKRGVLQLLQPKQKFLVPVLGKRSGYEDGLCKQTECCTLGFPWSSSGISSGGGECDDEPSTIGDLNTNKSEALTLLEKMELLPECALYIELEMISSMEAGDHVLALCTVVATGQWDHSGVALLKETPKLSFDPSTALYTAQLRSEGII